MLRSTISVFHNRALLMNDHFAGLTRREHGPLREPPTRGLILKACLPTQLISQSPLFSANSIALFLKHNWVSRNLSGCTGIPVDREKKKKKSIDIQQKKIPVSGVAMDRGPISPRVSDTRYPTGLCMYILMTKGEGRGRNHEYSTSMELSTYLHTEHR